MLHPVWSYSMEEVICACTKMVSMMHVCHHCFLPFCRFVPAMRYVILADGCHDGPKDNQIQLFMCEKVSLCPQLCIVLFTEQPTTGLAISLGASTSELYKLSTLQQFIDLLPFPWITCSSAINWCSSTPALCKLITTTCHCIGLRSATDAANHCNTLWDILWWLTTRSCVYWCIMFFNQAYINGWCNI